MTSTVDYTVMHPERALTPTQQAALLSLALFQDEVVPVSAFRHQTLHALDRRGLITVYNDAHAVVTKRGLKAAIRLAIRGDV